MNKDPFAAPRQNLALAEARLDELRGHAERFFAQRPYQTQIEPHQKMAGFALYRFRLTKPVPSNIQKLAREVAQALHRALDQLGDCTTVSQGRKAPRLGNRFPFAASAAALEDTIRRHCRNVAPEIVDLFRQSRPYPGGDDVLYALDQLCELPRRRQTLVPNASARIVFASDGNVFTHPATLHAPEWNPVRREVTILHNDPEMLFKGKVQVSFFFALGKLPALRSQSAFAVLAAQLQKVTDIAAAVGLGTSGDSTSVSVAALR